MIVDLGWSGIQNKRSNKMENLKKDYEVILSLPAGKKCATNTGISGKCQFYETFTVSTVNGFGTGRRCNLFNERLTSNNLLSPLQGIGDKCNKCLSLREVGDERKESKTSPQNS